MICAWIVNNSRPRKLFWNVTYASAHARKERYRVTFTSFDRRTSDRWVENRRMVSYFWSNDQFARRYQSTIEPTLAIARITYSSIFGRSIKARLMQTRLYVSREAIRAPSTVAHAYLARGPCPPRCGSRSRFSRTEANPRFRIPYTVAYREGPQALSPPPLSLWGPTCLPTERSKAKSRDNSRLETRYEFVNG